MQQEPFIYLSGAVARLSQRRGEWPDIRPAMRDIPNNLQIYGARAGDEDAGHVPVPATAFVREPRLDRLHAVQVAGHCLKGLEYFGDDDRAGWLLADGDVLHDANGLVAWRQLCVQSIDLEALLPVQGPAFLEVVKPASQDEQLKAPAAPAQREPSKPEQAAAWLRRNYPDVRPRDRKRLQEEMRKDGIVISIRGLAEALNIAYPEPPAP